MSKSTSSRGFRKVDVDQYDEDKFKDDNDESSELGPDEQQVSSFLMSGKTLEALKCALNNPPVKTKNPAAKRSAAEMVMRVLSSMKSSEIQGAVQTLNADEIDILTKYIYKCFSLDLDGGSCATLLTWHEKVIAKGGVGCIMRVLTDRKRL